MTLNTNEFMQVRIVEERPTGAAILPNTYYLHRKPGEAFGRLFKSDKLGSELVPFGNPELVNKYLVVFATGTTPDPNGTALFWVDGIKLYMKSPDPAAPTTNNVWLNLNNDGKTYRISALAAMGAEAYVQRSQDEMILIKGYGLFLHKVGDTTTVNNKTVFATANGRWLIEYYAGDNLRDYVIDIATKVKNGQL